MRIADGKVVSFFNPMSFQADISIDGENKIFCDIDKIVTTVSQDKIKCIRMSKYDYTKVIRTKFLS